MNTYYAFPTHASRPLPKEVEGAYRQDFDEATAVFPISAKASAAISRRLLQMLLRDNGYSQKDLNDQIEAAINSGHLPSHLSEAIDAVRTIGNFASHPIKSKSTGEVVEVEPGEAEWLLDTIEGLLDFYVVQPKRLQEKRAELDKKLQDAGKPPLR